MLTCQSIDSSFVDECTGHAMPQCRGQQQSMMLGIAECKARKNGV